MGFAWPFFFVPGLLTLRKLKSLLYLVTQEGATEFFVHSEAGFAGSPARNQFFKRNINIKVTPCFFLLRCCNRFIPTKNANSLHKSCLGKKGTHHSTQWKLVQAEYWRKALKQKFRPGLYTFYYSRILVSNRNWMPIQISFQRSLWMTV